MDPALWNAPLPVYQRRADDLRAGHAAGDTWALDAVHEFHPAGRDPRFPWRPGPRGAGEVAAAPLGDDDARLVIARRHSFRDWSALEAHVRAVGTPGSPEARFEAAVQDVIDGRLGALRQRLDDTPGLVHERSRRITCHDPAVHGATLLHYVAANGVEGINQRTPAEAVEVARLLLARGADPDATAGFYGGACSVMALLVSSAHPAERNVQVALIDLLVAYGASVRPVGSGTWQEPVVTALVFGYVDAAEALVRHGAPVETLDVMAGLGRLESLRAHLPHSAATDRHRALALAAQLGRTEAVRLLLDAGEDPNRFNPEGMHRHATPLHQAALGGHASTVRLLVSRGADRTVRDAAWEATPEGWARHAGHDTLADWLASGG